MAAVICIDGTGHHVQPPFGPPIPPLIWKDFDAESRSSGFQLPERTLSRKLELSRWRLCLLFDQAAQQGNTDGIQQIGRTQPVAHLFQSILDVRLVGADYHGDV